MCRIFALIWLTAIFGCAVTNAQVYQIREANDLTELFKSAQGNTLEGVINLQNDLDFSHANLKLPLGTLSDGTYVSYSGVFQGNGHAIKGLVMNNTENEKNKDAGLFYSLKDAIVKDLVIDSSCIFTGDRVGAMSVTVTGSLTVKNVRNKAFVYGNTSASGFIGYIEDLKQTTKITFTRCANDGSIDGTKGNSGGFVGKMNMNSNIAASFSHSSNSGNITSTEGGRVGGFIGYAVSNTIVSITISSSINDGTIMAYSSNVGGFIGYFENNTRLTMSISNSKNDGFVSGKTFPSRSYNIGGFTGGIKENSDATITIFKCINNKTIKGYYQIGGFLGSTYKNTDTTMTISHFINNGEIQSEQSCAGGFIGNTEWDQGMVLSISNSTNNGNTYGTNGDIGGFIGKAKSHNDLRMAISNSINNGNVSGNEVFREGYNYGGLLGGLVGQKGSTLNITNTINNGIIRGWNNIGGFIGIVSSLSKIYSVSVNINNSENKGNATALNEGACGLFCVESPCYKMETTFLNIVNKGNVNSKTCAYGISDNVTNARNVVSMGEVIGSSSSYTFWNTSDDVGYFYSLEGKCKNCTGALFFGYNTNTGFYEVVGNHEHVDDLLNTEVQQHNYDTTWTNELDLDLIIPEPQYSESEISSDSVLSSNSALSGGVHHSLSLFSIAFAFAVSFITVLVQ